MPRNDLAVVTQQRDPGLVEMTTDGAAAEDTRTLETGVVPRLGVRHVDGAGLRVDRHAVENGSHVAVLGRDLERRRVDAKHVEIRQGDADRRVPDAAERIVPVSRRPVETNDQARFRSGDAFDVGGRRWQAPWHPSAAELAGGRGRPAVAHGALGNDRGLVPRTKDGGIDLRAVRRDGQCSRGIAEEGDNRDRRPAGSRTRVEGIEHPDVGTAEAGGRQRCAGGSLLAARGSRDEGPRASRPGEDEVTGLVADQERADDSRRRGIEAHDAHAVREVVYHPDLAIASGRDGHWLEAYRNRSRMP